jgi:cell division protein FtsB
MKSSPFINGLIVIILVFGYMVFSDQGLARLYHLRQTENMVMQKNDEFRQEISQLKDEIKRLQKPAYLERVVREELGFLRSDEILYYVGDETE